MGQQGGSATICTEVVGGEVRLRDDRPAVVVTSTSWTPDEDVGLLVEAAQLYEQVHTPAPLQSHVANPGPMQRLLTSSPSL